MRLGSQQNLDPVFTVEFDPRARLHHKRCNLLDLREGEVQRETQAESVRWVTITVPVPNVVSRWLDRSSIQTTLVYLSILPGGRGVRRVRSIIR